MCHGLIDSIADPDARKITLERISFNATGNEIDSALAAFTKLSPKVMATIANLGSISLDGRLSAGARRLKFRGSLSTAPGAFDLDIAASQHHSHSPIHATGRIVSSSLDIGAITDRDDIGSAGFDIGFDVTSGRSQRNGDIECTIASLEWRGYRYADIATSFTFDNNDYSGSISIDDPCVNLQADGSISASETPEFDFTASIGHMDPDNLNLWHRYPGHRLSAQIDATLHRRYPRHGRRNSVDQQSALHRLHRHRTESGANLNRGIQLIGAAAHRHIDRIPRRFDRRILPVPKHSAHHQGNSGTCISGRDRYRRPKPRGNARPARQRT